MADSAGVGSDQDLVAGMLGTIVEAVAGWWAPAIEPEASGGVVLAEVPVLIADLSGDALGWIVASMVWTDFDVAGRVKWAGSRLPESAAGLGSSNLATGQRQLPWLGSFLLDLAASEGTLDPNASLQVVLPTAEEPIAPARTMGSDTPH